jgi:dimethylhistidine N-methyltransferase
MSQHAAALPAFFSAFHADVVAGLGASPKTLPCKYFYDEAGCRLFDQICDLPEYYPTRVELGIMGAHAREMASLFGADAQLVELGSGSSLKTRLLLNQLPNLGSYIPVDISRDYLARSREELGQEYPRLNILPVCTDYSVPFSLPREARRAARTIIYFPGSTLGNLRPTEARGFLARLSTLAGPSGGMLIGVDLKKDVSTVEAAYNDAAGVTAAFNLNLLARINRELGADFDLDRFFHRAFYNADHGRIEMHLVSKARQTARIGHRLFGFAEGEPIVTEYSYKYSLDDFRALACASGWAVRRVWTDERSWFGVKFLTTAGRGTA